MEINIYQQSFILSPERALFWKRQRLLVIADAHFSKEMHFRKNGIAVPHSILRDDLKRLDQLIQEFDPAEIIFLGDMFHSDANAGMDEFSVWRQKQKDRAMQLIIGNHDVLHRNWYAENAIECIELMRITENIVWSHDHIHTETPELINCSGHLHPYVRLSGLARQSLRMPCFWFTETHAVLPAFGRFTGGRAVYPNKEDRLIAVAEHELLEVTDRMQR